MACGVEGAMRGDAPGDDVGATVAETSGDSATTPASAVTAASGSVTTGGSIATSGGEGASGVTWGDATAAETSGGSATTPAPAATAASGPATTTPGSEGVDHGWALVRRHIYLRRVGHGTG